MSCLWDEAMRRLTTLPLTPTRLLSIALPVVAAAALVCATNYWAKAASVQFDRTGVQPPVIEPLYWIVCWPGFLLWVIKALLSGQGLHEGWGSLPTGFERVLWWGGNIAFWAGMFMLIARGVEKKFRRMKGPEGR
jgi:hypothetical protein